MAPLKEIFNEKPTVRSPQCFTPFHICPIDVLAALLEGLLLSQGTRSSEGDRD
ncbi:MAG: hypothetical protein F6K09_11190 [Merismopedia sp. SIO2A8]|nr:hypothetical protein [Symploca sp. SIO2B6]NET49268.1 hypothetical protein [Merismopedia sp. SIO2A8]